VAIRRSRISGSMLTTSAVVSRPTIRMSVRNWSSAALQPLSRPGPVVRRRPLLDFQPNEMLDTNRSKTPPKTHTTIGNVHKTRERPGVGSRRRTPVFVGNRRLESRAASNS
jgi:hypothetical protein